MLNHERTNSNTLPELGLIGLNYKSAPIAVREKVAEPDFLYQTFKNRFGSDFEHAVITTCNRTEIVFSSPLENFVDFKKSVLRTFSDVLSLNSSSAFRDILYKFSSDKAVNHFFKVACGLDSMILGEAEILGQVKSAYRQAVNRGTVKSTLHRLFQSAFSTAKDIRSYTGVGRGKVSVASTAVTALNNVYGSLKDKKVLLIGAGETANLISKHLREAGVSQFFVANRTESNARELVDQLNAVYLKLDRVDMLLPSVDVIVTAVNSDNSEFLIRYEDALALSQVVGRRAICFLDLSVPRVIDPKISEISSMYYFDVDSLSELTSQSMAAREDEAIRAEEIILTKVNEFKKWQFERSQDQLVKSLFQHVQEVNQYQLQRTLKNFGSVVSSLENKELIEEGILRGSNAFSKKIFGPILRDFRNGEISEEEFKKLLRYLGVKNIEQ